MGLRNITIICLTAGLSACSDTSLEIPSRDKTNDTPILARDSDGNTVRISQKIASFQKVSADYAVRVNNSPVNTDTNLSTPELESSNVSIRRNSTGSLVFTLDDKVYTLQATDLKEVGFTVKNDSFDGVSEGTNIKLFSTGGDISALWTGADGQHSYRLWYSLEGGNVSNTYGASILGARTPEKNLPTGSAAYTGSFIIAARPSQDDSPLETYDYDGNANLVVSFSNGRISGQLTNVGGKVNGAPQETRTSLNGSFELAETPINSGQFSGNVLAVGDLRAGLNLSDQSEKVKVGTYAGGFYGPNGEEAAGVMKVQFEKELDRDEVGVGSFIGRVR